MVYSSMTYDISRLFVCNLKQLGTDLDQEQQKVWFIMIRLDDDLGYDCLGGRYGCTFKEAITNHTVQSIRSKKKIPNPIHDTEIISNAKKIDINLFTQKEQQEGRVSDLRLMQIYNIINFTKDTGPIAPIPSKRMKRISNRRRK